LKLYKRGCGNPVTNKKMIGYGGIMLNLILLYLYLVIKNKMLSKILDGEEKNFIDTDIYDDLIERLKEKGK
jgi:hypothetical protein